MPDNPSVRPPRPPTEVPSPAARTFAAAALAGATLWLLGHAGLPTPPLGSWPQLQGWLAERSTIIAAMSTIRAAGCMFAGYLVAISGLAWLAERRFMPRLAHLTMRFTPRTLRPLFGTALSAGIATAAVSLTVPRIDPQELNAVATITAVSEPAATMQRIDSLPSAPSSFATTTTVLPATPIPPTSATPPPSTIATANVSVPPLAATVATPEPTAPAAIGCDRVDASWTVRPGEHLWSIASDVLHDAWSAAPTDAEIVPYWQQLIERNRARFVDPSNPDYVLAGQEFELPRPPARR